MAQVKINIQRLTTFKKRQGADNWGGNYVAAIFATAKEAPGISRPSILNPKKLDERDMHLLSHPEQAAGLLSLYDPATWEVHEGKLLSTGPRPHFLYGHPRAHGIEWPSVKGTVDVAQRMGRLNKHPKVKFRHPETGALHWVPFNYVGDLLLYREDERGVYCVNWTIKDKYKDFKKRGRKKARASSALEAVDDEDERHELERLYYLDCNIRTVQIAGEAIDKHVVANLAELFLHHSRRVTLDSDIQEKIINDFRDAIGTATPIYEHIRRLGRQLKVEEEIVQRVLRQAVWNRKIRLDLYQPLMMDQPLRPESRDVLEHYSEWFKR